MTKRGTSPRVATFVRAAEFPSSFARFHRSYPKLDERLAIFLSQKQRRPPDRLPRGFSDHALTGRLDGLWECHLDGDACLIYTDRDNQITLICVLDHADLEGPRERSTAKRLMRFITRKVS